MKRDGVTSKAPRRGGWRKEEYICTLFFKEGETQMIFFFFFSFFLSLFFGKVYDTKKKTLRKGRTIVISDIS